MPHAEQRLAQVLHVDATEPLVPGRDSLPNGPARHFRCMLWIHRLCCVAALQGLVTVAWYGLDQFCACEFERSTAANGTRLSQVFTKDEAACCDACAVDMDCAVATFYSGSSGVEPGRCDLMDGTVSLIRYANSSWVCVPPRHAAGDSTGVWMDNLIAQAPAWLRGAIVTAILSCLCRKVTGFDRNSANLVMSAVGLRGSYQPLGWDELVGRESVRELTPLYPAAESQLTVPSWEEARNANRLTSRQAYSVASMKLLLWHLSQPVAFLVALWVTTCRIGQHQREIASYVLVREVVYIATVFAATYRYPAFLLLNLRSTWDAKTHWTHRLAQLCTYTFAPHHYATLCLWRCGAVSSASVQMLLLFQLVSDCFGLCALGLFLGAPRALPPAAILVGYSITAVGFGSAASIAVVSCAAYALDTSFGWRKRLGFGIGAVVVFSLLAATCWFYLILPLSRRQ